MALSLTHALTEVAREDLSPGVRDMLPEVSGFFSEIKNTWEGVETALGRPGRDAAGAFYSAGWVKRWTVVSGGGGAFKFVDPNPELVQEINPATAGTNVQVWNNTLTGRNLSASDYVFPKYGNPYVGLKEGRGVLAMPWQLLRANKIDNVLLDVGAENIAKSAELTALSEAICFFSRNPAWGEVARTTIHIAEGAADPHPAVAQTDFAGNANDRCLTISGLWEEDTVVKFRNGMSVDIWEILYEVTADDLKIKALNTEGWVVDQVDYVNEKVTFTTKNGASSGINPTPAVAATDELCYIVTLQSTAVLAGATPETGLTLNAALASTGADSYAKMDTYDSEIKAEATYRAWGFDGLTDFIKTAATDSYYGISLSRMPNLISIAANVGDYLTEPYWNRVLGWFKGQIGGKYMPDAILTTYGVLNGALQNAFRFEDPSGAAGSSAPITYMNVDRTGGKGTSLNMDHGGVGMGHRGRRFKVYDDAICMRKNLFAVKSRGGNFSRLMPPPIPGGGKQQQFQDVQFLNSIVQKNIWAFGRNGDGAQTDFLEAPYVMTAQHFVKDPQAIRLRKITEAVGVS